MKMFKKNYWMKLLPLVCAGVMIFGVSFAGALTSDDVTNLYGADASAASLVEAMKLADDSASDADIIKSLIQNNSQTASRIVEIYGLANPDNLVSVVPAAISAMAGIGGIGQAADVLTAALQVVPMELRQDIVDAAVQVNPGLENELRLAAQPLLAGVGDVGEETEKNDGTAEEGEGEAFEEAGGQQGVPGLPNQGNAPEPPPVQSDKPASPV